MRFDCVNGPNRICMSFVDYFSKSPSNFCLEVSEIGQCSMYIFCCLLDLATLATFS